MPSLSQIREQNRQDTREQQTGGGRGVSNFKSADECLDRAGTHFVPRMGLVIMLSLTIWFMVTYAISFAENPEKYTDMEQSGVIYATGIMATLFTLGIIGSCKDEPTLVIPGLIGAGVIMFMAGHDSVSMVTGLVRHGGVYVVNGGDGKDGDGDGKDNRCGGTSPKYYSANRQYCNARTVVHVLMNILMFLLTATLSNAVYNLWKYLSAKKRNERLKWVKNAAANYNRTETIAEPNHQPPTYSHSNLAAHPSIPVPSSRGNSIGSCEKMKQPPRISSHNFY